MSPFSLLYQVLLDSGASVVLFLIPPTIWNTNGSPCEHCPLHQTCAASHVRVAAVAVPYFAQKGHRATRSVNEGYGKIVAAAAAATAAAAAAAAAATAAAAAAACCERCVP